MALEELFPSRPPVTRAAVCALMTRPIPCLQRPHTARLSVSHVILGGPDKPSSPGASCRNVRSTPLMITARVLCVPMSVYSLLSVIIGAPDVFSSDTSHDLGQQGHSVCSTGSTLPRLQFSSWRQEMWVYAASWKCLQDDFLAQR